MPFEEAQASDASPDFSQVYSEFAANLKFNDLKRSTVEAIKANILDTLACTISGVKADGAVEMMELADEWGGKPEAQVLWRDSRLPAPAAAWVNGILAHARDYDDVHDMAIVHAGVSNLPAALAAVEVAGRPVSGQDFYAGLAAGMELTTRMGVATKIGVIDSGFIYTSLFGYFGATAGASRILGFDPVSMQNALGITYSQTAGGHQVTRDGAQTKRMQPGFAARAALTSVAMTRKGVLGPRHFFEGVDGLWKIYLRNELDAAALRADLGQRFHIEDLCYKPYPSCRYNHTAVDAAFDLLAQPGFDWRKVSEIRAYTTAQSRQAVGTPLDMRQNPKTLTQAQFSICYNIACALVNGQVGLADFCDLAALERPEIMGLTRRIVPLVDPEIERDWGRSVSPTRLEAVIGDQVFTARRDYALGSTHRPFSRADVRRKLEDSLYYGGFDPARADQFEEIVDGFETTKDMAAEILRLSNTVRGLV